jgi:hypothetical protein
VNAREIAQQIVALWIGETAAASAARDRNSVMLRFSSRWSSSPRSAMCSWLAPQDIQNVVIETSPVASGGRWVASSGLVQRGCW